MTYIVIKDNTGLFRVIKGVHIEEGIHVSSEQRAKDLAKELNKKLTYVKTVSTIPVENTIR
jgi:hypothetical protein